MNGAKVNVVLASDDDESGGGHDGRRPGAPGPSTASASAAYVERVAAIDVEHDVLEPDAALFPEPRVLRIVPGEVFHRR
jgi:hypothetical protein